MRDRVPNFQPFPYARLPRTGRREAALVSLVARWVRASSRRGPLAKLGALFGGPVELQVAGVASAPFDPHAAFAEVRCGATAFVVAGSSSGVRVLAQRLLGGPAELAAPRPLTLAERAIFVLAVAAALADAGVAGEAWPLEVPPAWVAWVQPASPHVATVAAHGAARARRVAPGEADAGERRAGRADDEVAHAPTELDDPDVAHAATRFGPDASTRVAPPAAPGDAIELVLVGPDARTGLALVVHVPPGLALRVPPPAPAAWTVETAVLVAGCVLPREAVRRLAVGDAVIVEPGLALAIGDGTVGLSAAPGAIEARVRSGYVPRAMIGDDAHLELTVQLGTTRLSVRRLAELAVGEIVPLGRPLAGPYDIRVAGRLIGKGELIDVDGELGVRIVSMIDPAE